MAEQIIKGMQLSDGVTTFDVSALSNQALKKISVIDTDITPPAPNPTPSEGNNLIIGANVNEASVSYPLKNTDIKAVKSLRFYPGTKETKFTADADTETSDKKKYNQIHIKACVDSDIAWEHAKTSPGEKPGSFKDPAIRLRLGCRELELNSKNAYTRNSDGSFTQTDIDHLDINFINDNNYTEGKLKAKAIDVRAISNGKVGGSGGGIAVQIASCDSNFKENKFKIETARKVDVFHNPPLPTTSSEVENYYNASGDNIEGGSGIEIGTVNSQFESICTRELRRMANTDVFAVTRGAITLTNSKYDYPTQTDDSKDIKSASQASVKWIDLINTALYLKDNGLIPTDGSFYALSGSVEVQYNLSNVTATNNATFTNKKANYTTTISAIEGYTLGAVTYTVNGGETQTAEGGVVTVTGTAESPIAGKIVITATATPSV